MHCPVAVPVAPVPVKITVGLKVPLVALAVKFPDANAWYKVDDVVRVPVAPMAALVVVVVEICFAGADAFAV